MIASGLKHTWGIWRHIYITFHYLKSHALFISLNWQTILLCLCYLDTKMQGNGLKTNTVLDKQQSWNGLQKASSYSPENYLGFWASAFELPLFLTPPSNVSLRRNRHANSCMGLHSHQVLTLTVLVPLLR